MDPTIWIPILVVVVVMGGYVWAMISERKKASQRSYELAPEDAEFYVGKGDYRRWIEAMYRETPENERSSRALYDVPRLLENEKKSKEQQ